MAKKVEENKKYKRRNRKNNKKKTENLYGKNTSKYIRMKTEQEHNALKNKKKLYETQNISKNKNNSNKNKAKGNKKKDKKK